MKTMLLPLVWASSLALAAAANVPPTVVIQSAAMRPGTTLMDVVFRVNDPDNATVQTRALAFIDGVRSFAKLVKPVTFADGTGSKFGDTTPTNTDHTVTWDVAADWNIQLGQVKFEVLAVDSNGLLPFQGITIPAAAGKAELKINQIGLTDDQVFNGLLWFYASGDAMMEIAYGTTLLGSATSGVFKQKPIAVGTILDSQNAQPFLFKLLNISSAGAEILAYANAATRTQLAKSYWLSTNWPYVGSQFVQGWGANNNTQTNIPSFGTEVISIAAGGDTNLALKAGGTVIGWGQNFNSIISGAAGLTNVTAISMGSNNHALALKDDGTVVAWGDNGWPPNDGKSTVPAGLTGVIAISAGYDHSMALKNDGTVVVWGSNADGQKNIPAGLSGVTAISAGGKFCLALKNNGTVVAWGTGATAIPTGLTGVVAISASRSSYNPHALALRNDGKVVAWGSNMYNDLAIPVGLTGVTAIAAGGNFFSLALKNDGTVVAWGNNPNNQTTIPTGLYGVTAIAAGQNHSLAITKGP